MTTRILVTISRAWSEISELRRVLETVHAEHPTATLVHGDAPKGDRTAAGIWKSLGGEVEAWPAEWNRYGKRAGMLRNARMVESNPALVLSFIRDASAGATHCTDLAEGAGIPVVRYVQEES
jgi:hypothetical protein